MTYAEVRTASAGKSTRFGHDLGPGARRSRRSPVEELRKHREVEKKRQGQTALPLTSCGLGEDLQALPVVQPEKIEECERCGGKIDTNEPGHYKSPDERVVHKVCYEEGEPGDPVVDLVDEYPFMEQWPQQYTCGHYAHGPPSKLPPECPECEVPLP